MLSEIPSPIEILSMTCGLCGNNDDWHWFICGIDRFLCDPVTGNNVPVPAMPTGDGQVNESSYVLMLYEMECFC